MSQNLNDLIRSVPGHKRDRVPPLPVSGIHCDSRQVAAGGVFVAIKGVKVDGHDYAEAAALNGAAAVVAERDLVLPNGALLIKVRDSRKAYSALCNEFYGRPSEKLSVVGVTGTNGKTTTCYALRSILRAAGYRCGLLGTVVNDVGNGEKPSPMTTADSAMLQSMMGEMAAKGMTHAVMEVSSHALDQKRTEYIRFAAGVFTNLTQDHLDYHRNMTGYRSAKARLFSGLAPDSSAALNADDPASYKFPTRARRIWYGLSPNAPEAIRPLDETLIYAEILESTLDGSRFLLRTMGEERLSRDAGGSAQSPLFPKEEVRIPLVGRHNIYNALAAASAAVAIGCAPDAVIRGLESLDPVPGRLEPVVSRTGRQDFHVLVDYAHTENGLESILSALRPLAKRRLIVVFGAGGDRDKTKRPKMGRAVEKWADLAFITSDNPRSEDPEKIIEEIYAGVERNGFFRKVPDRRLAICEAVSEAAEGDLVVIAGKGHETTQTFRDVVMPFDDRLVAVEFLEQRMRRALMRPE